jgi:hypothetical protein
LADLLDGHNERMTDLSASRDALGIAQEKRDYEKSKRDEEGNTADEIAQRRRDLALKLQDMAQSYAAERAQRQQALQQALTEAAEQKKIQLAEEQAKYAEDKKQRQAETAQRLNDLQIQFNEETRKRREAFLRSVRDLDTALNGETQRKRQYYALMLKDAESFMKQWRSQMSPSDIPGRAAGGYAGSGIYRLGEVGTEFVANAQTTRALESMTGGSLTQDRLLALAARGGAARPSTAIRLQQNITFNGEDNPTARAQLRTLIHTVALDAVNQVIGH